MQTYNPKKITIAFGTHIVTGYADDSFVTISAAGDGTTFKQGCDGEIIRSVSPNDTYLIKMDLLSYSKTNSWLQNMFNKDQKDGSGSFPVVVKDLTGGMLFNSEAAWVTKPAERGYGKEANNRSWEIQTASGSLTE